MAETAIARYTEQPLAFLNTSEGWQRFKDITAIYSAGGADAGGRMMPAALKTPQQVQAGVLLAMSLGYDLLGALAQLQHMHSVEGKIGFDWEWKLARVYQLLPTWDYGITVQTDEKCVGWFQRSPKHQRFEITYTIAQALKAGIVKGRDTGAKGDGAWVTRPAQMLRKTVITQGISLTAPDALIGVPKEPFEEEVLEEEPIVNGAATPVAPEVLKASGAVVVEEGGGESPKDVIGGSPKGEPSPSTPNDSAREVFLAEAEKKGWNRKHGPSLYKLLQELLTVEGVKPSWKSAAEIPSGDWRVAYVNLCARYPDGKPKEGGKAEPIPADAGAAPAQQTGGPPPPESVAELREEGESPEDAQKKDPLFLVQVGQELEKAWRSNPGSVVRDIDPGKGKWWFTHEGILLSLGYTAPDGSARTMAMYDTKQYPDRVLTADQIAQLSEAVMAKLRERTARRT